MTFLLIPGCLFCFLFFLDMKHEPEHTSQELRAFNHNNLHK